MNKYKILGISIILFTGMVSTVSVAIIMPAILTSQSFSGFIILCAIILFIMFLIVFVFSMIYYGIHLIQRDYSKNK